MISQARLFNSTRLAQTVIASAFLVASAATNFAFAQSRAISVSDVWSRPSNGTAVVYATIRNTSSSQDRLLGATSAVATRVGMHRSSTGIAPGPALSMGGMTMPSGASMTSMRPVASIPIPPNGSALLAPGGYHLMLDLKRPIHAGETIPLRLHFARGGWIAVSSSVRPDR